ncbi:acetyl-CoA carboxylase biotin carboxylase subunit [Candidatus Nesciobacter abundans]|uniref:biotin carboxylase n=1 Tax=Candidatus Nesciobacter abundans TaxID=2601668 RepID=A0A5C0UGC9_9PROT|nr:acetyl-CoA carboxylase biotin carboxylase subunit [Candidatus Nesciobacter abundans]QEK39166.1 acetyl-CoA carboxylase biotin carboxylase subunit [Candidatus Nesciobacter abundans]
MIKKILIANRGEVALRIIRACKALSMETVAIYSEADKDSMHVRVADESVCIGPAKAKDSYNNMQAVMSAALLTHADAIHPGYGFLSENSEFAEMVEKHDIIFIGPSSNHIKQLGDKINSKSMMKKYNIPTIDGSDAVKSLEEAKICAEEIGFPVIIKASNGGGGKGIRICLEPADLEDSYNAVIQESTAIFGEGSIYIEKYLEEPRHIEFQILSDGKNAICLGERECSLQRRRQKIWEEAPSMVLTNAERQEFYKKITNMFSEIGYKGAATLEFLYQNGKLYFMEVNTRLQVEHTVTEEITGVDIVKWQIRVAFGEKLSLQQSDVNLTGHAIECRINAEDPKDFAPSPKIVTNHIPALGPYVRIESAIYNGYQIQPYYDSMISKLIVKGDDRDECIRNLKHALKEYIITGPKHLIPLFIKLVNNADVLSNNIDINWLEKFLNNQAN